ncbi:SCO2522 family protein [Micromonospora sp. WMMD956]|uniref:SCO2522 family protein n=1 Tax=Micromonospora sp. WMMD956 TaxID=3016108 RepID=UPI002416FC45|nr:SCO2522 family protein [Micromonospora sp. WMMD956]MDG4819286.1 SCO2522 family protein [Micromonospora sp. WMMD956]
MTAPGPGGPEPTGPAEVRFEQAGARRRVEAVPLARLSVELGHLRQADYAEGPDRYRRLFATVAPWFRAAAESERRGADDAPRVSTCYLVDDYLADPGPPREVVPLLLRAAEEHGVAIDYLARESACAQVGDVSPAAIVAGSLVWEPTPGTNGTRPPPTVAGWLSNGQRSGPGDTAEGGQAMSPGAQWVPPRQNVPRRHSVFVDVELWDERDGVRTWSCAFLAGVWQLLRLGLLRDAGRPVARPRPWRGAFPDSWAELPAVVQLGDRPAPFCAYRTLSVLPGGFLPVETAVRTILDQVAVDPAAARQVRDRAAGEGLALPGHPVDRLRYVFL